jgi:17beta-estradiol 17-dehydrogenase / very-long-chain 3-oxoacyl-CoA reductase
MDFSANREADFERVRSLVQNLDVAILVNNVGQSHVMPTQFIETAPKEMMDIITINCIGTLKITQIVAPGMVARKRGLILTMASFGGLIPSPLLATYSGSKAFLQQWSTALASELAPSGVQVQIVQSYLVTSAMSKIRKASMAVPTAKVFVRAALSKIGRSGGAQNVYGTSTPYFAHGLMHWFLDTFIGLYSKTAVDYINVMHQSIRKRALRKIEREAKAKKGE